jgi:hypothetical protein
MGTMTAFPTGVSLGEKFTLTTMYSGKDVVIDEGSGNYYPIARADWYPNGVGGSLGHYASYEMTFRIFPRD